MENIIKDFNTKKIDESSIELFNYLGIPLNRPVTDPISLNNIFEPNIAFNIIDTAYMIGSIDDNIFNNINSNFELKAKRYDSVLIFAFELNKEKPTRTELSQIARIFNRNFQYTPIVLLFKYENKISLANTQRQEYSKNQKWRGGEKIGKVSILRDIDIANPHRGHLDILENMKITSKINSYETLYTHWQEVFDVSILNKKFYKELSDWYQWTIHEANVRFPNAPKGLEKNAQVLRDEHNAKNVIRLLTRLLFVWFLKEKNLIPNELFEEHYIKSNLLEDFDPTIPQGLFGTGDKQSKYYKAILQNLFFATLNQEMKKRKFIKNEKDHKNITNLMRYESNFKDSKIFLNMVEKTVPFMNGGLFECLEDEDGFLDKNSNDIVVPDYILFVDKVVVDLSKEYGSNAKAYKKVVVRGLINILKSYKFTIAENTPIDEDVALDPELLGKVFENLLASYNPETKTTARKQTGSFYTPREIVSYMVDESLISYLKIHLKNDFEDKGELDEKLHILLSFNDENPFENDQKLTKKIIKLIDKITILDPAVGSGAFPMGALQKMVYLLSKLDPQNIYWKELQYNKALQETSEVFKLESKEDREKKLQEINYIFDKNINEPDYARKLYLIENCIFGVDIQAIAIQISKLRFFISLVVEQKTNNSKDNFGIRPLPNLESKFVTANTLIGLDQKELELFDKKEIKELENKLQNIRHRIFNATTPKTKKENQKKDKEIREEIKQELLANGVSDDTANFLSSWDPYDQNTPSPFFDKEWMFGIKDGFDIIIANPPYLREKGNAYRFEPVNNSEFGINYHQGKMDFWYYFLHKSIEIIKKDSTICFITPRYWINSMGASKLISRIKNTICFSNIVDIGKLKVFDNVAGQHMISLYVSKQNDNVVYKKLTNNLNDIFEIKNTKNLEVEILENKKLFTDTNEINFNYKSNFSIQNTLPLGNIYDVSQGVVEAPDKLTSKAISSSSRSDLYVGQGIFVLNEDELKKLDLNQIELELVKPYLSANDVEKYKLNIKEKKFLIYSDKLLKNEIYKNEIYKNLRAHLDNFKEFITSSNKPYGLHRPRNEKYFTSNKIVFKGMFAKPEFMLDKSGYYVGFSFSSIIEKDNNYSLEYLLSILNSKFAFYWFFNNAKHRGAGLDIGVEKLRMFPIKECTKQQNFIKMVNYIIFIKKFDELISKAFESVIDGMIFELYFEEHMKEKDINVLEFIEEDINNTEQNKIFEDLNDSEKLEIINSLYLKWTDPDNEVRNRLKLFAVRSPNILKPILESK